MTVRIAAIAWIVLLVASVPYVNHAKHPATKPPAAYFIFVGVLSLVAAALFYALGAAAAQLTLGDVLATSLGAAPFLLAVFAPAFATARRQLRRPPARSMGPPR